MVRKLKNFENETHTPFNLEYGGKHSKTWKMRNAHCRTWNMARKLKIMENENHPLDHVKNDKIPAKREK